jgi:hypothetical protein
MADSGYFWFVNDWRGSDKRAFWTANQIVVYRELIDLVSVSPDPGYACSESAGVRHHYSLQQIAMLCSCGDITAQTAKTCLESFLEIGALAADDTGFYQPQVRRRFERQRKRSDANRAGGIARMGASETQAKRKQSRKRNAQPICDLTGTGIDIPEQGEQGLPDGSLGSQASPEDPRCPPIDIDGIREQWNSRFAGHAIRVVKGVRLDNLRKCLREFPEAAKASWWAERLPKIADSWIAEFRGFDFDWVVSDLRHFEKFAGGKYDQKESQFAFLEGY